MIKILKLILVLSCLLLSSCEYGYRNGVEKYNRNLCLNEVKDGVFPFNLKAEAVIDDNGNLILAIEKASEVIPVIGPYLYGPALEIFSNNDSSIEWCVNGVIDFDKSTYFVNERGFKSHPIKNVEFYNGLSKIKDGEYRTRFRIAGTATNWCQISVTDGKVSSLKCPEDDK